MAAKKQEPDEQQKVPSNGQVIRSIRTVLNRDDGDPLAWDLTRDDSPTHVKEFISTGSTLLDYIISNRRGGGIPVGKITEIQGEESSGKSLLCAHIIANVQKKGGIAVYLDTENACNPDFMRRIGVDLGALVYCQPGTVEKCFETIEETIKVLRGKTKVPVVILWDSVGNTPPQAEIEGDYDPNSRVGLGAKAMAKGLRKVTQLIGDETIGLVLTNPLKAKFNVMYGDPWGTPYGKAVPYHSSVRVRVSSSTKLKTADGDVYGLITNGSIVKSRLGPGHRRVKFEIHFDHGVDDEASWFAVLHEAKLIEKKGGWCYIELPGNPTFKLRESEWAAKCREGGELRDWALNKLEELLVVRYDDTRPERVGIEVPNEESEAADAEDA